MWPTIAKLNNRHFPNMSRLVFVMEAQCVLCEGRTAAFFKCKLSLVFAPRFNPRPVRVRFVMNKVAVAPVSVPVLRSHPVSVAPPVFISLLLFIRRTNGRSLGTFDQSSAISAIGFMGQKGAYFRILFCSFNCWNVNAGCSCCS
jgi:hypothetical protein